MHALPTHDSSRAVRGFTVFELLIVVTMLSTLTGFALFQIATARQNLTRSNSAREFGAYLEKARLDSVRRHPLATAQMAQVSIINASFYSVTLDSDGDGTLDAPKVISLPAGSNLVFNDSFPRTIYFNWRGRTVDSANSIVPPAPITISNSYGSTAINVTNAGQSALDDPITTSPVTNSAAPAPNFRTQTQVP